MSKQSTPCTQQSVADTSHATTMPESPNTANATDISHGASIKAPASPCTCPRCDPLENLRQREQTHRLVDFINEVGMLRLTPRTGYQFLGTGKENVAEHSHRVAVIGYILAKLAGADKARTVFLCLFHDLAEARTGDFNYVNKMYNTAKPRMAMQHATEGTGLQEDILGFWDELSENTSKEAALAHDADQLDLIFNLKQESERGNSFALQWIESALKRLHTKEGQEIGAVVVNTPSHYWWFNGPDASWWEKEK